MVSQYLKAFLEIVGKNGVKLLGVTFSSTDSTHIDPVLYKAASRLCILRI